MGRNSWSSHQAFAEAAVAPFIGDRGHPYTDAAIRAHRVGCGETPPDQPLPESPGITTEALELPATDVQEYRASEQSCDGEIEEVSVEREAAARVNVEQVDAIGPQCAR